MAQISVITPAFNASKFIDASIQSILGQSFLDFELIVIDDASTDDTWEKIQAYAAKDPRVKAFRNPQNLGIAGNRNRGVSLATGKYLAWQDADDISLPNRLEHQLQFLENHPEVGIVGGYIEIFCESKVLGTRKYATEDSELRRTIFRYSPVAQPAAMLRMQALKQVGEYNLRFPPAEDLDMTFRIGEHFRLSNLPEVVLRYRESEDSATFTRLRKMELSTLEIRRKFWRSKHYRASFIDGLFNVIHFLSIWLIPPKMKIRLFTWMRDTRT